MKDHSTCDDDDHHTTLHIISMPGRNNRNNKKFLRAISRIDEEESTAMNIDSDDKMLPSQNPEIEGLSEFIQSLSSQYVPPIPPPHSSRPKWPARAVSEPVSSLAANPFLSRYESVLRTSVPAKASFRETPPDQHLSSWSKYVAAHIEALFKPFEDFKFSTLPAPDVKFSLGALWNALMLQVNNLDARIDECKLDIERPCPFVCPGPTTTPPPPAKSFATVAAQTVTCHPTPKPKASVQPPPTPRRTPNPAPSQATIRPPASAGLPPRPKDPPSRSKDLPPTVTAPVRLVVRFGGRPPQDLRDRPQADLFRRISSMLDIHPTHCGVVILGAHWNKSNNVIISFPHGTPEATILDLRPDIRTALGLAESVVMSLDKPWTKLLVSSVPARFSEGAQTFSEIDVAASLACNPAISNVVIPRQPRWIRNPANITGAHSLIVLSVEDPDGSVARRLLKTPLFIFGAPVTVKRWQINPKPKNCCPAKGDQTHPRP